jgi:hypothetical protein
MGAFLNDSTAAMITIANLDTVRITANVPEKDTSFVSKDQPVSVTFPAYPGKVYEGKVLFVSDVLEPDTRRTKVRIAFAETELLRYGLGMNDVTAPITNNTANAGGGRVARGEQSYVVRGVGLVHSLDDLGNIVVAARGTMPILVRDLGTLAYTHQEREGILGARRPATYRYRAWPQLITSSVRDTDVRPPHLLTAC